MHERAERIVEGLLSVDEQLERDFETALIESSGLAFRVAFSVLRHREDAEDVAQEALVRAHRSFQKLHSRDRFRAWLVRTTWRLAIDRKRGDRRRVAREFRAANAPKPGKTEASQERAAELWEAIDSLPKKLRLVTVLAGIEGHDVREVALLLGLPEGTVKSRLFLARRQLKERLQWSKTER